MMPAKKYRGIKRHIAVDTQGFPHAIHITTANVTDRAGALEALRLNKASLASVVSILAEGSYTGNPFATEANAILGATV